PRHAAHDRQIRNQRGQLGAELMGVLVRQWREGDRATLRTLPAMAAVLGDVRRDLWQLRHLMPTRLADGMPRVQTPRAAAARLRCEVHDRVHALDGDQLPMMARMAELSAGLASTLHATTTCPLVPREPIGRWRLRRDRRILLFQRELALEIRDSLRLLLELFAQPFVLLAQSCDFPRLAIAPVPRCLVTSRRLPALSRHRRERMKLLQKVHVQNRAKCQRA